LNDKYIPLAVKISWSSDDETLLSPTTVECQHGRYLNFVDLYQKISGIQRMVYPNKERSVGTQVVYRDGYTGA
jgi:hypothetical protein